MGKTSSRCWFSRCWLRKWVSELWPSLLVYRWAYYEQNRQKLTLLTYVLHETSTKKRGWYVMKETWSNFLRIRHHMWENTCQHPTNNEPSIDKQKINDLLIQLVLFRIFRHLILVSIRCNLGFPSFLGMYLTTSWGVLLVELILFWVPVFGEHFPSNNVGIPCPACEMWHSLRLMVWTPLLWAPQG